MHELALAQSMIDLVLEHAARDRFARVRKIRVSLGALAHVDPGALAFGFASVARGTIADGAALVVDRPPGRAFCIDCATSVTIAARGDACPSCGGSRCLPNGGDEMRVVELEVE